MRVRQTEFRGDEELDASFNGSIDDNLLALDGLRRDGGNDGVNAFQSCGNRVAGRVINNFYTDIRTGDLFGFRRSRKDGNGPERWLGLLDSLEDRATYVTGGLSSPSVSAMNVVGACSGSNLPQ